MYTDTAFKYRSNNRYKFNCYMILNQAPVYLVGGGSNDQQTVQTIYTNFHGLREAFKDQLTQRQYNDIGTAMNTIISMAPADRAKVVEFRFEGSGCYRSGDHNKSADYINTSSVTRHSVDFRQKNGAHNSNWGTFVNAPGFNEGNGLYGAMTIVCRNGDILGIFLRSSTLPDKMATHDTVAAGTYSIKVGMHPMSGGYTAVNLYMLGQINSSGRTLPALIDNTSPTNPPTTSGINAHKGFKYERGSEGCLTIQLDDYDYYIDLYNKGEEGRLILHRHVNINPADY